MKTPRRAAVPQRVVGVGASAGGLEALKQLVMRVPVDTGLAFVVLQHLPPSQVGQLARLLATWATVPVIDAKPGHRIAPNTILVVPPHTSAALYRGALVLRTSKAGARPREPIDGLLKSLASVLGERSVGVVLSGTGRDGTEGLRAIRAAGGLTVAQDPSTAQFDEMPRSAIAAGVAELVLAPPQIGDQLGAIAKRVRPVRAPAPKAIEHILEQLRDASGVDFTSYKRTTIERRLQRRLVKLHIGSLDEYSAYLASNPSEFTAVYDDLLVHVTEFFRDRPVFDHLVAHVLPDLIRGKAADAPVRVWVPGCATGEEVYTLAIVLLELLGPHGDLQLFGTDLSERSIEIARRGFYSDAIAAQVGAERLQRFFRREEGGYRIRNEVRERCVFVRHDLTSDPPFSKLDLVSCRNVLIYLGTALQLRVLSILHYALQQPGYLVLGRAETIAGFETMFATIDADARIYARRPAPRAPLVFPIAGRQERLSSPRAREAVRIAFDVQRDLDHVLLARYAPACVLVDEQLDVLQFRGHTGSYLESPAGQPQLNILRMARDGLSSELALAIQRARRTDAPVRQERVLVREGGRDHAIHLEVVPLRGGVEAKRYFLIVFEAAAAKPLAVPRKKSATTRSRDGSELARLRQELAATKEYVRSLVTQHVATSEELGIVNEELQSSNEELQSSNEELQTAKEELQSANEELETVNDELQQGNDKLRAANDDLVNVLASVEIAIIIVDTERKIRRFTPRARTVMKLLATDVGRPIADLRLDVTTSDLDAAIASVIETLVVHDAEVRHTDGGSYRMQIRPYQTGDHTIGGAVVAFVDITALRAARDHAAAIVEAVPTPLVVLDDLLRVVSANAAFNTAFGVAAGDVVARELLQLGEWNAPDLRERLAVVVTRGVGFDDVEVEHGDVRGRRVVRLAARRVQTSGERAILVGISDITEARHVELARESALRERDNFLDAVSHELRTPLSAILLWGQALRDLDLDGPRRAQAIEAILDSARAEAQLVDDLFDLTLSRTGLLAVKPESLDPSSIVTAAIDAARGGATEKQIAIESTIAVGSRMVADPRRLHQIAAGLIGNAIKFAPPGGRVWIALARDHGALDLTVRNDGPGMTSEFLSRAFEPFEQADRSSTRANRGLGIGLALVRHLVERHGGSVDVTSNDTHGTTFKVHLPASPA
jgi:two-component system, chemotaxis family, CheB/CheR fusion protein